MGIDLYSTGTKHIACQSSLTVNNVRASLDMKKQSFLFPGHLTWPPPEMVYWSFLVTFAFDLYHKKGKESIPGSLILRISLLLGSKS